MKLHKLPLSIAGIAFVFGFTFWYRYFMLYNDPSQGYLGIGFSVIILCLAYVYNWMHNQDDLNKKHEDRINAIVDMWTKNEKKAVERTAKGEEVEL